MLKYWHVMLLVTAKMSYLLIINCLLFWFFTNAFKYIKCQTYNFPHFSRKLLLTTDTELSAIAAPAIIGLSKKPLIG